ncbi:LirA/MavJ family T4SS effector [Paraburkholderia azotifigens]|uniref:LirA/MavJ family T4SS effector n=1 Tax=Paraburkholderia azotifigens TaxID=2057004 RepID=UPI00317C9C24
MPNTLFRTAGEALDSLKANKFTYTKWNKEEHKAVTAKAPAANSTYLEDFGKIARFLCDTTAFNIQLSAVSADMWNAYRAFDPKLRNKFTRAMGVVARSLNFDFQNRFTANTTPNAPIGIMLIGGDPQLGYMLRNKLFWKDSMDLRHGEHTHSLQWLAIAKWGGTATPAATLYSLTADYRAQSKDDRPGNRSMILWQWLTDCFPTDMKRLATATFLNGETLESQSNRAPQFVMDHLMSTTGPIADHFVSNYLYYRYKNRNWLTTEETTTWTPDGPKTKSEITKLHTGDPKTHRADTRGARAWNPSPSVPDARFIRDATTYNARPARTDDGKQIAMTFHGQPANLTFYYSD